MSKFEKIPFMTDEGEVSFYVIEQTTIQGVEYLMVSDQNIDDLDDNEDMEVLIMKNTGVLDDSTMSFEFVEDDDEMEAVFKVFEQLYNDED